MRYRSPFLLGLPSQPDRCPSTRDEPFRGPLRPISISMGSIKRLLTNLLVLSVPVLAASSVPGIDNFSKVDDHVYRGAQPDTEGFEYLAKLGVKVVLDLREHDSRSAAEERSVTAAGMKYVNVPMTGHTPPTAAETDTILSLLENPDAGPVFVHCRQGMDRTGAVVAAYRIDHDNWDNARALKDAKAHGMRFFQVPREHYISEFHRRLATAISSRAAITPATTLSAEAEPK
jgi:tyrosine-protein phosphatase SIW14